mmetsp:Transcript_72817/g.225179  ORF Transcript_72817/g.225179 Transcript_72817/m.225179 type:complete len:247 (+) Transcript_72817:224-964(+)
MRIPELSGEHRRIAYRILDLDMSGVRFRKEDVRLTLPGLPSASAATAQPPPSSGKAAPCGGWSSSDLLRLEAQGVSAQFRRLRCALKPPLLPEVCVTTDARAAGIKLYVGFAKGSTCGSGGELQPGLRVARLEVTIDCLEISLDKSGYSRLFNPLIGYFNEELKAYVCGCLEDRLVGPARELCRGLGALLAEAEPLLSALDRASAALGKQPADEQPSSPTDKLHGAHTDKLCSAPGSDGGAAHVQA